MSAQVPIHSQFPLLFQNGEPITPQKVQGLVQRHTQLKLLGQNEGNMEYLQISRFLDMLKRNNQQRQQQQQQQLQLQQQHQQQQQQQQQSLANGVDHHPQTAPAGLVPVQPGAPLPPLSPDPQPEPITFSDSQIDTLRAQITAFKYIQRGQPLPHHIHHAIYPSETSVTDLKKELDDKPTTEKVGDAAVQLQKAEDATEEEAQKDSGPKVAYPNGPRLEEQADSGIYPYNAYVHPLDLYKQKLGPAQLHASKQQQLLVPSLTPKGLDPYQLLAERNRFIDARIAQRIRELSDLSSTMGEGGMEPPIDSEDFEDQPRARHSHPGVKSNGKLRALIELKSLQLRDKQRALRMAVVSRLGEATILPGDRKEYKRFRKQNIWDVRQTESLERRQRNEREKRVKQKHLDYLGTICNHGQQMISANRMAESRVHRLAKAVLKYHVDTEKEEQKRIERISKERLKALKNDDEEAYLKLIDTAKDTRITALLRQTDAYLDSLARAVQAQQAQDGLRGKPSGEKTDESTFGASRMEDEDDVNPEGGNKVDYYSIAHRVSEKVTAQPSILVGGTLKDYQIKGLQWMVSLYNNHLNGILADEMGLGKTIQTISLLTFLIERKHLPGPFLVIVPLSTLPNWALEFEKWAPSVPAVVYKGSPTARKAMQNKMRIEPFKVVLTTFEYIIKDRPFLARYNWIHMVIDEGHRMKNTQSKLSQTLNQFYKTKYRLILTGTPLQNNLPELWALLNFVLPNIFNSAQSFDEWFNTPFANVGGQDNMQLNEEESLLVIRRLHKVLRPFLLRRLKKDVESELPDKVEKVIKCKMSALQTQLYRYTKEYKMLPNEDATGRPAPVKGLQNMVMQLRKICQHPFVFREVDDACKRVPLPGPMKATAIWNDPLIRSAGKVALLDRMLPKLFATNHRVLIFFQMTNVMDILDDYLSFQGVKHLRLDGSTKTEERGELLRMFNAPDSEYKVFILSTRAGGLGLNLQTADTVIIYDSDWNPHADLQAQDRAHRIGQKKAVRIFRFITEKSVEEAILTRARSKLDMDEKVIQAGRFDNKSTAEERDEYLRQLIEDQDDESQDATGDITDEELNEILSRSDEEQLIFRQMDIEREAREQSEWVAAGGVGPKPERLMQLSEIPPVYQQENPFPSLDPEDVIEGRGARVRKDVRYTDGLTDEQFAEALDAGIDLDAVVEENFARSKRAAARKSLQASGASTPVFDSDSFNAKKRGRNRGKGKASHEDSPAPLALSKRKRIKELSVTPSMDEDEEEDDDKPSKRRKMQPVASGSGGGAASVPQDARERMRQVFQECHKAVVNLTDDTGRKRCELFKELPSKKDYADYYEVIKNPIAISTIRKRASGPYYKTVEQYAQEWRLLFDNARRYNQEGSWVYQDADQMQKTFEATFSRLTVGSGLPGAAPGPNGAAVSAQASAQISDDEEIPVRRPANRNRKFQDDSDDDEYAGSE